MSQSTDQRIRDAYEAEPEDGNELYRQFRNWVDEQIVANQHTLLALDFFCREANYPLLFATWMAGFRAKEPNK